MCPIRSSRCKTPSHGSCHKTARAEQSGVGTGQLGGELPSPACDVQPSPAQQQSHVARCDASSLIGNGLLSAEPAVLPSHVGASPCRAVPAEGAVDEVHGAGRTPCRIPGPHGIAACCFPLAAQEVLQEVVGEAVLRGGGRLQSILSSDVERDGFGGGWMGDAGRALQVRSV